MSRPTASIPLVASEIRALLHQLKEEGKTIFLNSHLLGEVELICDRVVILQRGEVIREGDIAALTQQQGLYMIGLAPRRIPARRVDQTGLWRDARRRPVGSGPQGRPDNRSGSGFAADRGLHLRHLAEKRQTLEDLFIQTVEAAEPGIDQPVHRRAK